MKLFEHLDFEQAVIRAAEHFGSRGLRESIIEKDYFVTKALRILEQTAGNLIIFQGGTSLSKGWGVIERFSEDVDIFPDPATSATAYSLNLVWPAVASQPSVSA